MKFIIDLDGTLLSNDLANLDAIEFMAEVAKRKIDFMIMTNSVCHPEKIIKRLHRVGITAPVESVLNPIISINSYLKRQGLSHAYIVGSNEERSQVCVTHEENNPDVILFLDFEKNNVDYNELQKIFRLIQGGVPAVSASGSTYYFKAGHKQIDTGAFVVLFELLSEAQIQVFGKPNENYFKASLNLLKVAANESLVIGDDWKTDVLGAKRVGCKTILLKSGKYKEKDEDKGKPDFTASTLMETFEIIKSKHF